MGEQRPLLGEGIHGRRLDGVVAIAPDVVRSGGVQRHQITLRDGFRITKIVRANNRVFRVPAHVAYPVKSICLHDLTLPLELFQGCYIPLTVERWIDLLRVSNGLLLLACQFHAAPGRRWFSASSCIKVRHTYPVRQRGHSRYNLMGICLDRFLICTLQARR